LWSGWISHPQRFLLIVVYLLRSITAQGENVAPENVKRLFRSQKDRMIGGVAGGLAEYLNTDPTVIRLAFALTILLGGAGIIAYLVMWIVMPENPGA
jgi:phage shock protein PspC (stress-responsive transcriptional regulator)